ncbi:DUF1028 domain-containing protein [Mesohalobacter halotolerans]|uniref:DUF1028 domain-containing protein n=1 Tax=Mesohalobacter halotolerans TaxID=1883405 RepID=A0A4U5TS67_9FLAO|nr:DUF1028 domain-containing protein [Mesohalobacter halotolerans]MBS3738436.1 DUF1028 domain-containing protein [Psychroflexus sp.]TKS56862.1 DUF1028 domain-containing protein [Mesohalobacter halotolerans]
MKTLITLSICFMIHFLHAQKQVYKDQFAHTFSIVAKDEKTGEMGVAVQSHWFSVGTVVTWAKSGVGAVATQSFVNPSYGPNGLQLMEEGLSADKALERLIRMDQGEAFRQVAFIDKNGNTAAHTGSMCVDYANHISHKNFSVQANMMLNDNVVPAMQYAFMKYDDLPLAERLVEVLKAAQKAGGDIRGKQSAALVVVGPEKAEHPWEDKLVDLRVDDHKTPIKELERLLKVKRGYDWMNKGDLAIEDNDIEAALDAYSKAEELLKGNIEVTYWKAVSLWNADEKEQAIPILKKIFKQDKNWKTLTYRLIDSEIISASAEELDKYFDN